MTSQLGGDIILFMDKRMMQYGNIIKYKINKFTPLFIFFTVYMLMFSLIEKIDAPEYFYTYGVIDKMIPFCEFFVIPYFAWFIMIPAVCIYLLFANEKEYRRMSYMLVFGMSAFIIISIIMPTKLYLRPYVMPRDNIFCEIVSFLYHIDTSTNVFPSIHVYNTCVAMQAVRRSHTKMFLKPGLRLAVDITSVLIILSTVFIKQHSILDVLGGLVLFVAADRLVTAYAYSRGARPAVDKSKT